MSSSNGNLKNQRLDSWKEIAAYLRRDERTAIRWEKDRGLPVHRVPGGKRQTVFAFPAELDAWLTQEPQVELPPGVAAQISSSVETGQTWVVGRTNASAATQASAQQALDPASVLEPSTPDENAIPRGQARSLQDLPLVEASPIRFGPFRRSWLPGLAVISVPLAITAVVVLAIGGRRGLAASDTTPVRLGYTLNSVQAFDGNDHLLWTYGFHRALASEPLRVQPSFLGDKARIADFLGDGNVEALVPAPFPFDSATESVRGEVDLLSSKGELLWAYKPEMSLQFGKHKLERSWALMGLFVPPSANGRSVWAAFGDSIWGNSFVVQLDSATGRPTLRYVNTGTLRVLAEFHYEKNYLVAGGFNNEPDLGSLALVDESRPFAASPQTAGTRHECLNCPAGVPDYYFVFPRSEVNEIQNSHEDSITDLHIVGNKIEAIKGRVLPDDTATVHYEIQAERDFEHVGIRFNSGYDTLHRKFEQEGKLHHTLENCPERLHPRPIRRWTPSQGWTTVTIESTPYNQ